MAALLEARDVSKVFGAGMVNKKMTYALQNATMSISDERPSITAIAGESGSGKTTLARLLLGIIEPSSGQVLYKGEDLQKIGRSAWKVFRREVQAVFQDPFEVFNPFYKVDNVLTTPIAKFYPGTGKAEARTMIEQALSAVGLRPEETLGRYPHQLSGGQRQRVMVARALILRPRVIIADEPVSMVDASLRATILESLLKVHKEYGISLVYITHDLTTAYQLCETILMMYRGRIVEAGDVDLVIKQPQHPYTQLLVDSIPLPNPKLQWGQRDYRLGKDSSRPESQQGCAFAPRCPFVMEQCWDELPPMYRTDARRGVACFQYQGAPVPLAGEMLAQV
jgi:peptide/nickel transport system ATP-binding protein